MRVLPTPPGPVSVSRRTSRQHRSLVTAASSRSRPTNEVSGIGRFAGRATGAQSAIASTYPMRRTELRRYSIPWITPTTCERLAQGRCPPRADRPEARAAPRRHEGVNVAMMNVDPDDLIGKAYDARVARRLLSYAAPYKRRAFATAGLIFVVTTSDLLIPKL